MKCLPLFCTALAFAIATTSGCKKKDEEAKTTGTGNPADVVASVDGVTLLRTDLDKQSDTLLSSSNISEAEFDRYRPLAERRVIEEFVIKTLLLNDAKKLGITPTAKARTVVQTGLEARSGQTLEELFKKSPWGEKKAREEFEESVLLETLIQEKLLKAIVVSDEEVEATSKELREAFEKAEMNNKLIAEGKPAIRAKLEEIKKQLEGGADFAELAKKFSACPSADDGGSLGTFSRERMVKEFADAAFSQEIGKVGDIVETKFGYHLILVTAKTPAVPETDNAEGQPETVAASHILLPIEPQKAQPVPAADELRQMLQRQQAQAPYQAYLRSLQEKAKIETILEAKGVPGLGE